MFSYFFYAHDGKKHCCLSPGTETGNKLCIRFQVNTSQWKSLAEMVKLSLVDFNKEWKELSYEVGEEGEWGSLRYTQNVKKEERYGEDVLEAGSKARVSLGLRSQSKVSPRILFSGTGGKKSDLTSAEWQKRLCQVLRNGEMWLSNKSQI